MQGKRQGHFRTGKDIESVKRRAQDLLIDGVPVYERMGNMCEKWGEELPGKYGYSGVGAVVGATYPEQIAELRKKLPHTFFLIPGYAHRCNSQGHCRRI